MSKLGPLFTSAPGLTAMATAFERYRINGLGIKITCWPLPQATDVPVYLYIDACNKGDELVAVDPGPKSTPEQRWSKTRIVSIASNGAKPTVLRHYLSVAKISGPDATVKGDAYYTGQTSIASLPLWETPTNGPHMRAGVYTMTGADTTAVQTMNSEIEFTIYLKAFQRRPVQA